MKKLYSRRMLAWVMTFCLLVGCVSAAGATQAAAKVSDFDALVPFMDLVGSAAENTGDEPEVIGNEETTLSTAFLAAFFNIGLTSDASLGITENMLSDTDKQTVYLGKYFSAQLPALEKIAKTEPINGYIGFQPVTVNTAEDGQVQLIGELYWGSKPMRQMQPADYQDIQWLDRAIYTFQPDSTAQNGYRLTGFSVGSELNMEDAMQTYTDSILVEYVNTNLGFSILYPSVFTDEMLVEDDNGVSASLPDGSVSFFVRRTDNASNANLTDYINVIANGIPGAKSNIQTEFSSGTVAYSTDEGKTVFDVYIVTDKYIYQAELSYKQELASTYSMYTSYLDNSFAVDEVSVG
ncbi:MAG TPA: hypothetical protein PKN45_01455 [Candidatus Limiplasma sp.]|nr:hypothetical protein [Candidatus Limiplasma sp.]HPR78577.1 hypothetical protein [Candidatus Limiplasma sp.]